MIKKNKIFLSDRTAMTLFFAVILIIAIGSRRPKRILGMHQSKYWATKISWNNYSDAVITGDSRILNGISPSAMKETLKGWCIVNYGFAFKLYDTEYLDSLDDILKINSDKKTIILGITPHSLTEDPKTLGQFSSLKSLSKFDIFIDMHFAPFFSFFEYMNFNDFVNGMFPSTEKTQKIKEFFDDGWLAYSRKPPGEKKELETFKKIYERCQVSPNMIDNMAEYISNWTKSGIRVYGFLVPTCQEMYDLENEFSGLNLPEFKNQFQSAGGIWIEIDPAAYDSFDGSHLQRESAVDLSRTLALKINEVEKNNKRIFNQK